MAAEAVERAASAVRIAADVLAREAAELAARGDPATDLKRAGRECGKTAAALAELGRYFRDQANPDLPLLNVPAGLR